MLATVSGDLLGVPLRYRDAQIAEIMSPRHFVDVRHDARRPGAGRNRPGASASRARCSTGDRAWLRRGRATRWPPPTRALSRPERGAVSDRPTLHHASLRRLGRRVLAAL